jgi:hypothetical protein
MSRLTRFFLVLLAALAAAVVATTAATPASSTTFSGRATALQGNVLTIPLGPFADTGDVSASGGALEANLLDLNQAGVSAEVLHATVFAGGSESKAQATLASLSLADIAGTGNSVSASFLMAEATASCSNGTASISGGAEVANLVVNGEPVVVTGAPNQEVSLPLGGKIVINEQPVASASGGNGELTVNALHIMIPGVADIVVASAHADIQCGGGPPQCPSGNDFVTSGGWIDGTPTGARANFGIAGGVKNGSLWGHLTYIDHGAGMKVKGTGVTAYTATGPTSRHIEGTATINGDPGTYQVDLNDKGEPGRNDTIQVAFSNGYTASDTLDGGNVQLHLCK